MRISLQKEIKSTVLKLVDIEKLAQILDTIAEDESEDNYKRSPDFAIKYKKGFNYKFDESSEFTNQLKSECSNIERMNMSFYGEITKIIFYYNEHSVSLEIESTDKGNVLGYIDDIKKIFKEKSWNWIINTSWFHLPITIIIFSIISLFLLFILKNKFQDNDNLKVLLFLSYIFASIIVFPIIALLSKLYPNLIISQEYFKSGRILKQDLWKILAGIITLILIPILINKI